MPEHLPILLKTDPSLHSSNPLLQRKEAASPFLACNLHWVQKRPRDPFRTGYDVFFSHEFLSCDRTRIIPVQHLVVHYRVVGIGS